MKISKNHIRLFGKLLLVLLLIGLSFVYAMFQGGFVSWFLFYSFIPFGLYSIVFTFFPMKSMQVSRQTNQKEYMAGEKLIGTITINRRFPFPLLYLVVEEDLSPSLLHSKQSKKSKVILYPGFKRNLTYQYVFDAIPRGEHFFSAIRLKTGDLFGLIEKEVVFTSTDRFLVYPHYIEMIYRQLESRFEQGATASNVKLQRDTAIAIGVREYKPGDRFSWIDWKTSARKNDIMTKEFEQQQSHDVVIFMDRSNSQLFEPVVTFSASLSRAILKKGAQLAFMSIGGERSVFPLRSGEIQLQEIFYHLAKVQDNSTIPFTHVIENEAKKMQQTMTFMFVTSKLTEDMLQTFERLASRNMNITVFIVKEKVAQFTSQELSILETLRKRNVFAKVVYEGHYSEVFFEVSRS